MFLSYGLGDVRQDRDHLHWDGRICHDALDYFWHILAVVINLDFRQTDLHSLALDDCGYFVYQIVLFYEAISLSYNRHRLTEVHPLLFEVNELFFEELLNVVSVVLVVLFN